MQWIYGLTSDYEKIHERSKAGEQSRKKLNNFIDMLLGPGQAGGSSMYMISDHMGALERRAKSKKAASLPALHDDHEDRDEQLQLHESGSDVMPETDAGCMIIPHPDPVFNASWAASARYEGTKFFRGRLVRKFAGVFPFFVQGEVYESTYYEEALAPHRPVGFVNRVVEMWYETDFEADLRKEKWGDDVFTSVLSLVEQKVCKPVGPPPHTDALKKSSVEQVELPTVFS